MEKRYEKDPINGKLYEVKEKGFTDSEWQEFQERFGQAIGKVYGSGDTETKFICPIEPTKEIIDEYERRKNVFDNTRKKALGL